MRIPYAPLYYIEKSKLDVLSSSVFLKKPIENIIERRIEQVDSLCEKLILAYKNILNNNKTKLLENIASWKWI